MGPIAGAETADGLLILGTSAVDTVLAKITVEELVHNQSDVFRTYSTSDRWQSPLRSSVTTSRHTHLFMPSAQKDKTTIKCVAVPKPDSDAPSGLPATGLVFDGDTGKADVVLNVAQLTAVRTAAGCLAASVAMQPSKTSKKTSGGTMVIFGTGNQARWHARLFSEYYQLGQVTFVTTNPAKLATVRQTVTAELNKSVRVNILAQSQAEVYDVLSQADFVCCCTPSTEPLFSWSRPSFKEGVHFTLIGSYKPHMQEVPPEAVQKAAAQGALAVDSIEACSSEAGDLLKASSKPSEWQEVGYIIAGKEGSQDVSDRFSMFKSVGFALQDLAIFGLVVEQAKQQGLGHKVPFF